MTTSEIATLTALRDLILNGATGAIRQAIPQWYEVLLAVEAALENAAMKDGDE